MKFSRNVGNGPMKKWLNFGGDPDHTVIDFINETHLGRDAVLVQCAMVLCPSVSVTSLFYQDG